MVYKSIAILFSMIPALVSGMPLTKHDNPKVFGKEKVKFTVVFSIEKYHLEGCKKLNGFHFAESKNKKIKIYCGPAKIGTTYEVETETGI